MNAISMCIGAVVGYICHTIMHGEEERHEEETWEKEELPPRSSF